MIIKLLDTLKIKVQRQVDNYVSKLDQLSLQEAIQKFINLRFLCWVVPGGLWAINLFLFFVPFKTLDHSFLFLWLIGTINLIAVIVINRMLMNFTTRSTEYNQDERAEILESQLLMKDAQVSVTLGGTIALPFTFTMIPYTQFLLLHPTEVSVRFINQLNGSPLFTRLLWIIIPITSAAYLFNFMRSEEHDHAEEMAGWLEHYEYHAKPLHHVLSGTRSQEHLPVIKLGTSMETGDYVVQTLTARRQNSVYFGPIGSGKTSTIFVPQIFQDINSYLRYIRDYPKISKDPTWMKPHGVASRYLNGFNVIDPTNDLCHDVYDLCMRMGVPKSKVIWIDPENKKTPGINLLRGPVEKAAENVTNIIGGLKKDNNDFFAQSERNHLKNFIYLLKLSSVMENHIATFADLIAMYNDIELVVKREGLLGDYVEALKSRRDDAQKQAEAAPDDTDKKSHFDELNDKYDVAYETLQWFQHNVQTITSGGKTRTYSSGPHQGQPMHADVQEEYVRGLLNTLDDISKNIPLRRVLFRDSGDFNLDDFLYNGGILLCNTAKAVVGDQLATILGQIYTLSFQAATYRREPNCAPMHPLYADEFPDYLSKQFAAYAAQARKYNVPIIIAAQSPAQLSQQYGPDYYNTLMSVMLTRGTFGDMGASDAKLLEPLFGEHEQTVESVNQQQVRMISNQDNNRTMISQRREKVPNISANEIMDLERYTVAVRTPGQHSSDMFNRIRVSRITDEQIKQDQNTFDIDDPQDHDAFEYMQDHVIKSNPDFDAVDREIISYSIAQRDHKQSANTSTGNDQGTTGTTIFDQTNQADQALENHDQLKTTKHPHPLKQSTQQYDRENSGTNTSSVNDTQKSNSTKAFTFDDDIEVSPQYATDVNDRSSASNNKRAPVDPDALVGQRVSKKVPKVRQKALQATEQAVNPRGKHGGNDRFKNGTHTKKQPQPSQVVRNLLTTDSVTEKSTDAKPKFDQQPFKPQLGEGMNKTLHLKDGKLTEDHKDRRLIQEEYEEQQQQDAQSAKHDAIVELKHEMHQIIEDTSLTEHDKVTALQTLRARKYQELAPIFPGDIDTLLGKTIDLLIDRQEQRADQQATVLTGEDNLDTINRKMSEITPNLKQSQTMDQEMQQMQDYPAEVGLDDDDSVPDPNIFKQFQHNKKDD